MLTIILKGGVETQSLKTTAVVEEFQICSDSKSLRFLQLNQSAHKLEIQITQVYFMQKRKSVFSPISKTTTKTKRKFKQ